MQFLLAAAAVLLSAMTPPLAAAVFSKDGLCDAFRLVKRGQDLVVVCPGPADWMTVKNWFVLCPKTKATKVGANLRVECLR